MPKIEKNTAKNVRSIFFSLRDCVWKFVNEFSSFLFKNECSQFGRRQIIAILSYKLSNEWNRMKRDPDNDVETSNLDASVMKRAVTNMCDCIIKSAI